MYYTSYTWDEEKKGMNWGVHDGATFIKRGFKTRKAAREWCVKNGMEYHK